MYPILTLNNEGELNKAIKTIEVDTSLTNGEKIDRNGLVLVPQPTNNPYDPLNWPRSKKLAVTILLAIVTFSSSFSNAVMNPAFSQIGLALNKSSVEASYIGTVGIAGLGSASFLWSPLANVYGRRPILILAQTISVVCGFASAFTDNYNGLIAGRFLVGFGAGAAFVQSVVIMSDMFFLHERGKMIGIINVALINGPHFAPLPGGYVATYISWHWTLILPNILAAACLVALLIGLPETLYLRGPSYNHFVPHGRDTFLGQRRLWGFRYPGHHLRAVDFVRPLQMLKYLPIIAVALYSGVSFAFGALMLALTSSTLFRSLYGWNSAHVGVALSVSTTLGTSLGELVAGPIIDYLMFRARMRTSRGEVKPESRLHTMWLGVFLLPLGLVLYGCMIHYAKDIENSWVIICVAMGMTCFAVQVIVTPSFAYVVDCYKPQAAQTVQLLYFTNLTMGFTAAFWAIPFGNRVGFQYSGMTYALVNVLFFIPVALMMLYGEAMRKRLGAPVFYAGH